MKAGAMWSLALVQCFHRIKVPTGLTAALVPPHVLTKVLLSDHTTVHRPLVSCALISQSSWLGMGGWGRRGEELVFIHLICRKEHQRLQGKEKLIFILDEMITEVSSHHVQSTPCVMDALVLKC